MKLSRIQRAACITFGSLSLGSTTLAQKLIQPAKEIPTGETKEAAIKVTPEEMRKEISYGLGFQNGEQYASHGFLPSDLDKEAYLKGLLAALYKKDYDADPVKFDAAMRAFDELVRKREAELAKKNAAAEKAFFAKNGKRKGVITSKTGLQYEILKKGTGKTYTLPPGAINGRDMQSEFHVFTRTTLLDGTVLNENTTEKPERYSLQVIQGLAEALQSMPVGSKWKLYVPSSLAFGERRFGAKVGPNSMIVYVIELKDIKVKKAPPVIPGQQLPPGHP